MTTVKTSLGARRWQFLVFAMLLQWVSTLSRVRGTKRDQAGRVIGRPPRRSLVSRTDGARTSADRAARVAPADGRTSSPPSPKPGRDAESSTADRTRIGLLALAVTASAGIHIGLTPEHLDEMPRLGAAFIVVAVLGLAIAAALVRWPGDRRIVALAGLFCLGQILAWVLFVTIRVPLFPGTPEPVETIALVSKAVEAVGWMLAVAALGSGEAGYDRPAQFARRPQQSELTPV